MKAFLDTPLLVYLNTLTDEKVRERYENFYLDLLSQYKLYTDVLVLDELLYVSKKKYKVPYNITIEFIDTIVLPYVTVLSLGEEEYSAAREILMRHNLKPSDALHAAVAMNNGIKVVVTEDSEFDRVEGLERLWLEP